MTNGEASRLETEVVVFPADSSRNSWQAVPVKEELDDIKSEEQTINTEIKSKFVRLRKPLRKRSISIL